MTKKMPSSRDQKAFTIHDANLSPVEEQENEKLIDDIRLSTRICMQVIRLIRTGDYHDDVLHALILLLEKSLSDASRTMRKLRKLQKEFD